MGSFYLALIPAASTIDFLLALGMEKVKRQSWRRMLVTLSIGLNLGILATFKYMPLVKSDWTWVFPLGISFYTFQALSYTIDVYRRDAKATSSILSYLAAVHSSQRFLPDLSRGQPRLSRSLKRKTSPF